MYKHMYVIYTQLSIMSIQPQQQPLMPRLKLQVEFLQNFTVISHSKSCVNAAKAQSGPENPSVNLVFSYEKTVWWGHTSGGRMTTTF